MFFFYTVFICLSLIHFIQLFTELVSLPLNHWASSKLITFVFVPRISGRGVFRTKSLCWHSGEGNCTTQTQSMATVVQRSSFLRGKMNLLLCYLRFCRLWIVFMLLIYIFWEENILKYNCTITCESNKLRLRWILRSYWVRPPIYMYLVKAFFHECKLSISWNNQANLLVYLFVYSFSSRWVLFTLVLASQLMFPNHIFHFIWRRHFTFRRWGEQNISAFFFQFEFRPSKYEPEMFFTVWVPETAKTKSVPKKFFQQKFRNDSAQRWKKPWNLIFHLCSRSFLRNLM